MKFVVDTNVFKYICSEDLRKDSVDAWLATVNDRDVYVTAMTFQENQKGIEKLKHSAKPERVAIAIELENNLTKYLEEYSEKILPLDVAAAREWGRRLDSQGTKNANDLAILAIAAVQEEGVVVTNNTRDFARRGVTVIDPFHIPAVETPPD